MAKEQTTNDTEINQMYEKRFESIENGITQILLNQDVFHDKMFVDNGVKSYQTFRRSAECFMKVHLWVYGVLCTGIILTTVGIFVTRALK